MAIKKVFKCTMPNLNYVTRFGTNLNFGVHSRYETDHPGEIEELNREVANKHPHILIDPHETEIDTTLQDKIREAQIKATQEVLAAHNAEQEKQKQSGAQIGTQAAGNVSSAASLGEKPMSPATLLGVANSATIAGLAANSNSGAPQK